MKIQRRHFLFVPLLMTIVLLISACSTPTTTPGSNSSSLSVADVMQKSIDAMKKLKSSHIDIQSTSNIVATSSATPAAGTPSAPNSGSYTFKVTGDQAGTDKGALNLVGQDLTLSEVLLGDKIYIKSTKGKWYVFSKQDLENQAGSNPFSGITFDQNTLLGLVQHSKITDHGDENLNNQSLRHISSELDRDALKQLIQSNPQLKQAFGNQDIDAALNNLKTFKATVDVWIDETNFYLHRTQVKLTLGANTTSANQGTPSALATNLNTIIDLSKFNENFDVTAPAGATPSTDPSVILGFK